MLIKFPNALVMTPLMAFLVVSSVFGQSVGLPLPRLLTISPLGGQAGTDFDVVITGENIEGAEQLSFSDEKIKASQKVDGNGVPIPNQYSISIAKETQAGIYEARVMTKLGVSSCRVFSVGTLKEQTQKGPNISPGQAMELMVDSVCSSVLTNKAIDYYRFEAIQGTRYVIACEGKGIDSKLDAVLSLANATGQDIKVDRSGGLIDFVAKKDESLMIKVNDLTFKGGPEYFYRLSLRQLGSQDIVPSLSATKSVSAMSWPPTGLAPQAAMTENEPDVAISAPQRVNLPCDIAGSFYPAADMDLFEFEGKKGEVWWVELASERLGCPTDASIVVQRATQVDSRTVWVDVVELQDIPSPVKPSSNGYAYDGPPFDAGSPDTLGKIELPEDGLYRLQVSDLFGGTRSDRRNIYRLIVRKGAPDFSLAAWGLHMELRNGDRNALSKPISLRGGTTMALEVVVVRRDGFDGEINLAMDNLPPGVTVTGLKIPVGKTRGVLLVTAHQDAPRGLSRANIYGEAMIDGQPVRRRIQMAEMKWPIPDSWGEIPEPRLVGDAPVSVSGHEFAPISLVAAEEKVWEVDSNAKLTIPLKKIKRSEFSADTIVLRTLGDSFERNGLFNISIAADQTQAVIDVAALKIPAGEYKIAFYGGAVAKYQSSLINADKTQPPPRDIVDIVVSEPITVRVKAGEAK